jgi:hypothetical protein
MANKIQIKRGVYASLPTLDSGEFGWCTNTYQLYVGTGSTNYEILMKVLFNANTILAANADNTPLALTIAEQRILGRKTGGNVAALTASEILSIIGVESGADVTDATNVNSAGAVMESDYNANTFLYATSDNTPTVKTRAETLALLSGQATASFSMNNQKITSLLDPTAAQDAASKAYVDSVAQGLKPHDDVACATTANITLSGEQTIDGVLTSTSRILVKNQTTVTQNGIYVTASGAWARASDMNGDDEVAGSFVFVSAGTTLSNTGWVCTNEPELVNIDTDNITFAQFSSAGYIDAGTGLTKSGNTLSVDTELAALAGLTSEANKIPMFSGAGTATLLDLATTVGSPGSDTNIVSEQGIREALNALSGDFVGLTDTPANFTDDGLKVLRVNSGANAVEFVTFASTYLESSPSNGETGKAPDSNWAYDHNAAVTGVHGVAGNTILHNGSGIDGGTFT